MSECEENLMEVICMQLGQGGYCVVHGKGRIALPNDECRSCAIFEHTYYSVHQLLAYWEHRHQHQFVRHRDLWHRHQCLNLHRLILEDQGKHQIHVCQHCHPLSLLPH